jgi:hypothetical protein
MKQDSIHEVISTEFSSNWKTVPPTSIAKTKRKVSNFLINPPKLWITSRKLFQIAPI